MGKIGRKMANAKFLFQALLPHTFATVILKIVYVLQVYYYNGILALAYDL